MGSQGEIFNILGIEIDTECFVDGKKIDAGPDIWSNDGEDNGDLALYKINGHTIASCMYKEDTEFDLSIPCNAYGPAKEPQFGITILGHSYDMGSRHFHGKALVGYPVANEVYLNSAVKVTSVSTMEAWKPRLVQEIYEKLGLTITEQDVELHLLFDSINGW